MEDKVIQFVSNLNGQFIEVSYKKALYQCMDLVYDWIFCLQIPKSAIQHEFAYQAYEDASDITRQYFELIPNTPSFVPQAGDIAVWKNSYNNNGGGHIAVVIDGSTKTKLMIFEQNNPTGTNAHIQSRGYGGIAGFLRPKNVIIDGVPQWLTTLLQEQNLTILNESEIRAIFDKGKKYDDEVKSLEEQVKSANENLADKALEVSSLTTKNQKLTSSVDDLDKLYSDTKKSRDDLSYENNKLNALVEKLTKENDDIDTKLNIAQEQINDLNASIKELKNASVNDMDLLFLIGVVLKKIFNKNAWR